MRLRGNLAWPWRAWESLMPFRTCSSSFDGRIGLYTGVWVRPDQKWKCLWNINEIIVLMPAKVWCLMYMLHMQPNSWLGRAMSENHLSATWKGPRGVGEVTPLQSQRKHSSPAFPLGFFCIHQSAFWERASFLHKESHCSCVFWLRHGECFRFSSPRMSPF